MSTQAIIDYLTKKLFIDNNIVTYRSLSRDQAIHVNTAKNELANYHAQTQSQQRPSIATYLLSGEIPTQRTRYDDESRMEVDMEYDDDANMDGDEGDDGEDVPQTKIVLVGENELEHAKSQYTRLHSIHIYSLSPSSIKDAGLICGPTEDVRQADNGPKGPELAKIVGKVIGAHIEMDAVKAFKTAASSSKMQVVNPPVKGKEKEKVVAKEQAAEKEKTTTAVVKPKATGKLDFSKAKTKEMKKEEAKEVKKEEAKAKIDVKAKQEAKAEQEAKAKQEIKAKQEVKTKQEINIKAEASGSDKEKTKLKIGPPKRGTKRKSIPTLLSDEESEAELSVTRPIKPAMKPKTVSHSRVKKGVVLSDESDEEVVIPSRRKGKGKSAVGFMDATDDSETDKHREELKAMMDVDDDEVIRVSREPKKNEPEEEEEEEEESDVAMDDDLDIASKPKPKKKKERKVIPVGRNGIKKKRVVKSRMMVDDKGYMATEDYSSYESVDEEEPEVEKPVKSKAKGKAKATKSKEEDVDVVMDPPAVASKDRPAAPSKDKLASSTASAKTSKVPGIKKPGKSDSKPAPKKGSIANFFGPPVTKAKK